MKRRLFKTLAAVLAIAAAAAGPVRGQNSYNVTFGGFNNPGMNTTVNVASLPQTFTAVGNYGFYPFLVINNDGTVFTSASVTSGGNGKVSVNLSSPSQMTITVTGTFEGTATIHVVGEDYNEHAISRDITVTCPAPPTPHTVRMAEGTEEAANWSLASGDASVTGTEVLENVMSGSQVTATYNGTTKKVKSVKAVKYVPPAPAGLTLDLATVTTDTTVEDGYTLTGTLGANVKISIADGATVTLDGVTINGVNDMNYEWAGITCLGDATIILSGTNTVTGFYGDYPGIQAAAGKTLIINGTGSLTASSYGYGAGIGGKSAVACGDIEIQGGTITATSGEYGAGIGGGYNASWGNITISGGNVTATGGWRGAGIGGGKRGTANVSCGNILISGGTVNATGGEDAAGIGGGRGNNNNYKSSCGTITITSGVTKVTATKGEYATNSIGAGSVGTCGTVTIGGNVGAITTSPYTYQP